MRHTPHTSRARGAYATSLTDRQGPSHILEAWLHTTSVDDVIVSFLADRMVIAVTLVGCGIMLCYVLLLRRPAAAPATTLPPPPASLPASPADTPATAASSTTSRARRRRNLKEKMRAAQQEQEAAPPMSAEDMPAALPSPVAAEEASAATVPPSPAAAPVRAVAEADAAVESAPDADACGTTEGESTACGASVDGAADDDDAEVSVLRQAPAKQAKKAKKAAKQAKAAKAAPKKKGAQNMPSKKLNFLPSAGGCSVDVEVAPKAMKTIAPAVRKVTQRSLLECGAADDVVESIGTSGASHDEGSVGTSVSPSCSHAQQSPRPYRGHSAYSFLSTDDSALGLASGTSWDDLTCLSHFSDGTAMHDAASSDGARRDSERSTSPLRRSHSAPNLHDLRVCDADDDDELEFADVAHTDAQDWCSYGALPNLVPMEGTYTDVAHYYPQQQGYAPTYAPAPQPYSPYGYPAVYEPMARTESSPALNPHAEPFAPQGPDTPQALPAGDVKLVLGQEPWEVVVPVPAKGLLLSSSARSFLRCMGFITWCREDVTGKCRWTKRCRYAHVASEKTRAELVKAMPPPPPPMCAEDGQCTRVGDAKHCEAYRHTCPRADCPEVGDKAHARAYCHPQAPQRLGKTVMRPAQEGGERASKGAPRPVRQGVRENRPRPQHRTPIATC